MPPPIGQQGFGLHQMELTRPGPTALTTPESMNLQRHAPRLLTLALAISTLSAQAQLIDDVEYRREGADAVLQIRLITEIQYQRAAIGRSGDLTQAFYLLLPTRQTLNLITAERRLAARGAPAEGSGLPGIVVTDEASSGRAANERRVLIRLDRAVPHQVPVAGVEGDHVRGADSFQAERGLEEAGGTVDPADGIHEQGDPRVGRPHHPHQNQNQNRRRKR